MADVKTFFEQVKAGDLSAVKESLSADASLLNTKNESGQTAFLLANYYGKKELAQYLLSQGPDLDIYSATLAGNLQRVATELDRDPGLLESHNSDGWTPLHIAAFFGQQKIAELLLTRGAKVDSRSTNAMKNTPLHAAAAGQKKALVQFLLEHQADANARQEGGWTALHAAAQNGDREMVELLLAHSADAKVRAENNQSPVDLALLKGHQEIVELLEEIGGGPQ